jgi:hypothetical protein
VKNEQSKKGESKRGSQENMNEVEERDSSQGCMDDNEKEDIRIATQKEVKYR